MTTKAMEYASAGERAHARALVRWLLAKGLTLQVKDEEEILLRESGDEREILSMLAHSGLNFIRAFDGGLCDHAGTFLLVWGNAEDGSELVADCSANELCEAACDAIACAY